MTGRVPLVIGGDGVPQQFQSGDTLSGVISTAAPVMNGAAAAGSSGLLSDAGHVHPSDTGRLAVANPFGEIAKAGTQTSALANLGLNATGQVAFRNRLINGNFAINQRGYTSNTALSSGVYGHDRWKSGANGCTYTFTQGVPDTLITITAGTLLQIVDAPNVEGGTYVASWAGTTQARATYTTAGGSSATTAYGSSPLSITGVGAGTPITVEFGPGGSGSVTLGLAQLEPGSAPTVFERRHIGFEASLCLRYYWSIGPNMVNTKSPVGVAVSTSSVIFPFMLIIPMRATPSLMFGGTITAYNGTNYNPSNLTIDKASPTAVSVNAAVAVPTAGSAFVLLIYNASSYLAFSAEL